MEQIFLQDWGCGWDGEAAAGEATEHLHHSTEQQTALNFNIKHPRPYKSFDPSPPPASGDFLPVTLLGPSAPVPLLSPHLFGSTA